MLKFIQNNREITALLAVVLLFVLPGFLDRQYLSVPWFIAARKS